MGTLRDRLNVVASAALLAGLALLLVANDQWASAITYAPNGDCFFDQSCDSLPGALLARHMTQVGRVVLAVAGGCGLAAVLAAVAGARGTRGSRNARR